MGSKTKLVVAIVAAFAMGAGATHVLGTPDAFAGKKGSWECYAPDRLPDVEDASDYKWARKVARGLNQTAASAKRGTILTLSFKDLICVKQ